MVKNIRLSLLTRQELQDGYSNLIGVGHLAHLQQDIGQLAHKCLRHLQYQNSHGINTDTRNAGEYSRIQCGYNVVVLLWLQTVMIDDQGGDCGQHKSVKLICRPLEFVIAHRVDFKQNVC